VNKTALVLMVAALIAAAAAGAVWYQARAELRLLKIGELESIAALLKEDQDIVLALQTDSAPEKDSGILASYLAKIRADGVPKHADTKQRLDTLAENNVAIVTLIKAYSPGAKTPAFITEGDKFRNYASAWRDRWNSVMELFMAGGNYAASGVPFPAGFPAGVDAELAAAK
jgi:hypothetical protein